MRTELIKGYIDEIAVSNVSENEKALLRLAGYAENDQGEWEMSMKFGDGYAYVPNGCGVMLTYPTIEEVKKSERMQEEICKYTGRRCEINQFDIALKYGKLSVRKASEMIVEAIKSDKVIAKHIFTHHWTSGSSTEVYPITMWINDVVVQMDTHRPLFNMAIKRVLESYPYLFKNGYFCENDDSCPAEIKFLYTDMVKERLALEK